LHLFYLDGDSVEAACHILGLSRAGFYRRLDRARRRLAEILCRAEETTR
jgi:predicted DNA-binding protein (UPF0251 family)